MVRVPVFQDGSLASEEFGDNFTSSEVDIPRTYNDGSLLQQNKPYTLLGSTLHPPDSVGRQDILTDPVWSHRVGPVGWAGTSRATEPGIPFEQASSDRHRSHIPQSLRSSG